MKRTSQAEDPPEDRVLLRDALVALLQPYKRGASNAQLFRIRRLEERLRRFPSPTGLQGQMERITDGFRPNGANREAPALREKAELDLAALVNRALQGMRAVSLVDQRLEVNLEQLQEGMPKNPVAADVKRLELQIEQAERLGHKVRKQTIQERAELSLMLQDMSDALKQAGAQSEAMTSGIERIARTLAAAPMPEELAETRRQLLGGLKGVYQETSRLNSRLQAAEARSRELEDIVVKTRKDLAEAQKRAATDPLTSLANRGAFDRALTEGIQSARRLKRPLSLLIVDIDHFKSVNDTWGHPVGDVVLQTVSDKLRQEIRDQDTVARFGGEEFTLILEGAPAAVAYTVAERIRQRVAAEPVDVPPEETPDNQPLQIPITLSAGFAVFEEGDTGELLLKRADKHLYEAKRGGRNKVMPRI